MTVPTRETQLGTERLILIPCNDEHLEGLHAMNADPEVAHYLSGRPQTWAETEMMIARVKERWAKWGYSWWTFLERQSGDVVGAGCIQNLRRAGPEPDADCPLEIGWRVRRDRWRQGIAIEAARAMAQFAFDTLRAELLLAICDPANHASAGVMLKLGMRYRGLEHWLSKQVATYEISAATWRSSQ
jgi:RimJ/RimL family protein N-acetyltransferase